MTRNVSLIDTTLRDGQQSLWASRMTTAAMLPILPLMDEVGFAAIEHMSTMHFDVCVRYLKEDPWERMRLIRQHAPKTPIRMLGMSQFFSISRVLPDEVVELFNRCCANAGVDEFWITASMNDTRTAEVGIRTVKELGRRVEGGIQYTISPVHDDDFFIRVTREFVKMGVDGIVLKDAGGLLTPERASTLVPKLVAAADGLDVYCHSHCVTGMGPATNLAAIDAGVSSIWVAAAPLSNGSSLPCGSSMARHLAWKGYDFDLDREALARVDDYFERLAGRLNKPVGRPAEFDPAYYEHQMPGGMITNFRAQLADLGLEERLGAVLEETPRVRAEFGYPNMQTPYSQFIATQALLNVIHGRYEVVPDEVRRLALGYWGKTPGPIDEDVRDRVTDGKDPITVRPGEAIAPVLERVRSQHGPFASEEELLLAVLLMPALVDEMRAAGPMSLTPPLTANPIVAMVQEAADQGTVRRLDLRWPSG